jgi:hypothetical protein
MDAIRQEVSGYIVACAKLLAGDKGAHDEFMLASQVLQQKHGQYTDQELAILQNMIHRVSIKLST